ncbi:hypothetical protein ABFS83_07G096300 [Erythranthe nasuta]
MKRRKCRRLNRDEDVLLAGLGAFLVQAVGNGGGGGFVDEAEDVEAGDCAGVFRCLSPARFRLDSEA